MAKVSPCEIFIREIIPVLKLPHPPRRHATGFRKGNRLPFGISPVLWGRFRKARAQRAQSAKVFFNFPVSALESTHLWGSAHAHGKNSIGVWECNRPPLPARKHSLV